MPIVNFINENKQVHVNAGTNLRQAALKAGLQPYSGLWKLLNCHGNGICAKCLVQVDTNGYAEAVSPLTSLEEIHLKGKPDGMRLSCQVVVHGNLDVRTHP